MMQMTGNALIINIINVSICRSPVSDPLFQAAAERRFVQGTNGFIDQRSKSFPFQDYTVMTRRNKRSFAE